MAKFFLPSVDLLRKLEELNHYKSKPTYWTSDVSLTKGISIISEGDFVNYVFLRSTFAEGVRVCTKYSSIKDKCTNLRKVNNKLVADYGENVNFKKPVSYYEGDNDIVLESMYRSNCLLTTGKTYKIKDREFKEYYYNDDKFVRVLEDWADSIFYSWYQIKPITWTINEELDIAITEDVVYACPYKETKKYLRHFDKIISPSTLDNLKKDNIMLPPKNINFDDILEHRIDINVILSKKTKNALIHNTVNSIPKHFSYNIDSLFDRIAYLNKNLDKSAPSYINYIWQSVIEALTTLKEMKEENKEEYLMLDIINDWIYVLKTNTNNVKYENNITNIILDLKKNIKFEKEKSNLTRELHTYKGSIIKNNFNLEGEIVFHNLNELERKVISFIDKNYNGLYDKKYYMENSSVSKTKSDEVQELIDEINLLLKDYPEKEKIKAEVKEVVSTYMDIAKKEVPQGLSLEVVDKKMAYATLLHDLNNIKDKLKLFSKENKKYLDMINLIDEWIKILTSEDNYKGENNISNNILTIKNTIFPYLETTNKDDIYRKKLLDFLNNEKDKIYGFIKSGNTEGFKDVDDFEYHFRVRYENYLLELNKEVRKSSIINDIRDSYNAILNNSIINSNNKYVEKYLYVLNDILLEIRSLGTFKEISFAENLLNEPINYNEDIITILDEIKKRIIELYKIELYIKEEINNKIEDESHDIDVHL